MYDLFRQSVIFQDKEAVNDILHAASTRKNAASATVDGSLNDPAQNDGTGSDESAQTPGRRQTKEVVSAALTRLETESENGAVGSTGTVVEPAAALPIDPSAVLPVSEKSRANNPDKRITYQQITDVKAELRPTSSLIVAIQRNFRVGLLFVTDLAASFRQLEQALSADEAATEPPVAPADLFADQVEQVMHEVRQAIAAEAVVDPQHRRSHHRLRRRSDESHSEDCPGREDHRAGEARDFIPPANG